MIIKSIKWSLGLVAAVGLTACNNLWDRHHEGQMHGQHQAMQHHEQMMQQKHQVTQKKYAAKGAVQRSTPGPVRKAAPQLPVIQ